MVRKNSRRIICPVCGGHDWIIRRSKNYKCPHCNGIKKDKIEVDWVIVPKLKLCYMDDFNRKEDGPRKARRTVNKASKTFGRVDAEFNPPQPKVGKSIPHKKAWVADELPPVYVKILDEHKADLDKADQFIKDQPPLVPQPVLDARRPDQFDNQWYIDNIPDSDYHTVGKKGYGYNYPVNHYNAVYQPGADDSGFDPDMISDVESIGKTLAARKSSADGSKKVFGWGTKLVNMAYPPSRQVGEPDPFIKKDKPKPEKIKAKPAHKKEGFEQHHLYDVLPDDDSPHNIPCLPWGHVGLFQLLDSDQPSEFIEFHFDDDTGDPISWDWGDRKASYEPFDANSEWISHHHTDGYCPQNLPYLGVLPSDRYECSQRIILIRRPSQSSYWHKRFLRYLLN